MTLFFWHKLINFLAVMPGIAKDPKIVIWCKISGLILGIFTAGAAILRCVWSGVLRCTLTAMFFCLVSKAIIPDKTFALPLLNPYTVLLFACLAFTGRLAAQAASPLPGSTAPEAVNAYQAAVGYGAQLYEGSEYIRTYPGIAGHPFLFSDSMQKGTIAYDGVLYQDVWLNYDIVRDEVVIKGPHVFALRLAQHKIDSFSINGHRLFYFAQTNELRLATGIYEMLHNGKVQVLAKRIKQITTSSRADESSRFTAVAHYFVLLNGVAYKVSDKKDLLKAFGNQKGAVQKYLQGANLAFRKEPEQALKQIATFYDQIQN